MTESRRTVPRRAVSLATNGGANQADAKGANINTIVAQYKKNGTLPNVARNNPLYGDFTFPETDIHAMFEAVEKAQERFMQLPADVRAAAKNDKATFLEMWQTDNGRKTLEDAGIKIQTSTPTNTPTPPPPDPDTPTLPSTEEPSTPV